jgi:hypothetical protein
MSSLREKISEEIKHNRPNITSSSIKTYVSLLYNIHKKLNENTDDTDIEWFSKKDKEILEFLKDKEKVSRKTILSALYVLTKKEEYQKQMLNDCKDVNDEYKKQKKTQKQEDNWISADEIKQKYDELKEEVLKMFSLKQIDYKVVMSFLVLALLGGIGIAPRRSMDYTELKIKNYDASTDNYYKAGKMYFNVYKTAKKYGTQTVDLKTEFPELDKIIKKWIKYNPTDYLLFSSNKNKLSSPQITKILNSIFDKNISTDMLRHIYLSEKFKNIPAITEMEKISNEMGHNVSTQMEYIKK